MAVIFLMMAVTAAEHRVIPFASAQQFRMGAAVSNRIVHPAMGAKKITLNLSVTDTGTEFAQHIHDISDDTILVLEGAADLRQGPTRRRMVAGQAVSIPPGEIHGTITAQDNSTLISFQTPPDFALYSGARDPSRAGAKPLEGRMTLGAPIYLNWAARNGFFLDEGVGAPRVKAAHYRLKPGETFRAETVDGGEQVLFVWKGAVTANGTIRAKEKDTIFTAGAAVLEVRNTGAGEAVVIQAQSPPAPGNAFAGRWTLESVEAPARVAWMEIAATRTPSGAYFGSTGGRLAELKDVAIVGGELRFRVERRFGDELRVARVRARRVGEGLEGSTETNGRVMRWQGWRTVNIADRDDGSWRDDGPAEALFTGALPVDWERTAEGVIRNKDPKAKLLVSAGVYRNFRLELEYKLPKGGNSGVGLRDHYELQLFDDYGQAPDVHGNVSLYSQIAPRVNASRPAGDWQKLTITLVGRDLTVNLNGQTVIDHESIRGLTGLAASVREGEPGPVSLQGDHGGVEFRRVRITRLTQAVR